MESQQVSLLDTGPRIIKVGSRKSRLALIQTQMIIDQLNKFYSDPAHLRNLGPEYENGIEYEIISMTTSGDQILDKALPDIGSKSLFTKELEVALIEGAVDLVVHSLKDLPTTLPDGCAIGAVTRRSDPNDTIVLSKSLQNCIQPLDLLFGCGDKFKSSSKVRIGTSSQRRIAMLRRCNKDLKCLDIRGNLNTRLEKLDNEDGDYDAIVLARAGLERMNWSDRASGLLSPQTDERLKDWCYAVGQGALAVECRDNDDCILRMLAPIVDQTTTFEAAAERSLLKHLEGGCSVPLGVRTEWTGGTSRKINLKSIVLSVDGTVVIRESDEAVLSNEKGYECKPRHALMKDTTGIVLLDDQAQTNLIECCKLGVKVANKMIDSGCLRLMRPQK